MNIKIKCVLKNGIKRRILAKYDVSKTKLGESARTVNSKNKYKIKNNNNEKFPTA